MAFVLDGPSHRGAARWIWLRPNSINWSRLAALGLNLTLWVGIAMLMRRYFGR